MRITLGVFLLAGKVAVADLHTVLALKHIMESTVAYHKSLSEYDGSYAGGISLWRKSASLLKTLKAEASHANASLHERLTPEEDEQLEQEGLDVALSLAREVQAAVDTAISKKPLMEGVPLLGRQIALQYFNNMHKTASHLGSLFGPKVSQKRSEQGQKLIQQVDDEFKRGLQAFRNELPT
ncbi:hydrophobic surface binding protein A domain-containing protein [Purpureocillium lavendulum]|uniref:Hydrophobic surface binding protein A domain-containing protein n=1 Tax=Purpureocillium lavendulum TaxID=1247861 RepID=A0AB34FRC8_9HYPO|nr:hydrophobic surface binding protein A domain-containing protein [Purpureocillium lavendulum]